MGARRDGLNEQKKLGKGEDVGLMGILCILGGCAEMVDVSPCVGERRRVCRPNGHNMHIGRLRGEGRCIALRWRKEAGM